MASIPNQLSARTIELNRSTAAAVDQLMIAIAESFPELHRWIPWAATMPTRDALLTNLEEYDAKFESDSGWHYSLFEIDGGALVGEAGLRPAESEDDLEIGYWVRTDRSGRGYATQAARALTTAAFESPLGVASVKMSMDSANGASAAVPHKLGYRLEESVTHKNPPPGHSGTSSIWVIRRSDWSEELPA